MHPFQCTRSALQRPAYPSYTLRLRFRTSPTCIVLPLAHVMHPARSPPQLRLNKTNVSMPPYVHCIRECCRATVATGISYRGHGALLLLARTPHQPASATPLRKPALGSGMNGWRASRMLGGRDVPGVRHPQRARFFLPIAHEARKPHQPTLPSRAHSRYSKREPHLGITTIPAAHGVRDSVRDPYRYSNSNDKEGKLECSGVCADRDRYVESLRLDTIFRTSSGARRLRASARQRWGWEAALPNYYPMLGVSVRHIIPTSSDIGSLRFRHQHLPGFQRCEESVRATQARKGEGERKAERGCLALDGKLEAYSNTLAYRIPQGARHLADFERGELDDDLDPRVLVFPPVFLPSHVKPMPQLHTAVPVRPTTATLLARGGPPLRRRQQQEHRPPRCLEKWDLVLVTALVIWRGCRSLKRAVACPVCMYPSDAEALLPG
ncbi:hypothetical protein B0H13DRAFT_2350245 [Mycena leptocephala]|nr:hypothetical protein B0H13DRAFT_2350245 [Mycena leptocephala]